MAEFEVFLHLTEEVFGKTCVRSFIFFPQKTGTSGSDRDNFFGQYSPNAFRSVLGRCVKRQGQRKGQSRARSNTYCTHGLVDPSLSYFGPSGHGRRRLRSLMFSSHGQVVFDARSSSSCFCKCWGWFFNISNRLGHFKEYKEKVQRKANF